VYHTVLSHQNTMNRVLFTLALLLSGAARAQYQELTTPIKNRSDLLDLRMTGTTTAYVLDRTLGTILDTTDAGGALATRSAGPPGQHLEVPLDVR